MLYPNILNFYFDAVFYTYIYIYILLTCIRFPATRMEVDEDLGGDLLRQFNCLNTSDKDVLVQQLQNLLSQSNISDETAKFYLDMADW